MKLMNFNYERMIVKVYVITQITGRNVMVNLQMLDMRKHIFTTYNTGIV